MSNRFQEIFRLPSALYLQGSPVLIKAGVILKDTETDRRLVQLKLQNISRETVVAFKISIHVSDAYGNTIEGVEEFSYDGIRIPQGFEFGIQTPIYLADNNAVRFAVFGAAAVYSSGQVWRGERAEWFRVPPQRSIDAVLPDTRLRKQLERVTGGVCLYVPAVSNGLFQCTCGELSMVGETAHPACRICGKLYASIIEALNVEKLTAGALEYEEQERRKEEKEKQEREERERVRRNKRISIIRKVVAMIGLIAIAYVAYVTTVRYILPEIKYRQATSLLHEGRYDEANQQFLELGNYKNSVSLARNAASAQEGKEKEDKYLEAIELYESGDYYSAMERFYEMSDYKDASQLFRESIRLQSANCKDDTERSELMECLSEYQVDDMDIIEKDIFYEWVVNDGYVWPDGLNTYTKVAKEQEIQKFLIGTWDIVSEKKSEASRHTIEFFSDGAVVETPSTFIRRDYSWRVQGRWIVVLATKNNRPMERLEVRHIKDDYYLLIKTMSKGKANKNIVIKKTE